MRGIETRAISRSHYVGIGLACGALIGAVACRDAPDSSASAAPAVAAATTQSSAASAKPPAVASTTAAASRADLIARGKSVYNSNCIACHNADPAENGAIGPAIAGASMALLEAKVIHNTYPPGYKPKRDTNAMIALPYLAKDIPALHAYLDSTN